MFQKKKKKKHDPSLSYLLASTKTFWDTFKKFLEISLALVKKHTIFPLTSAELQISTSL